MGSHSSRRAYVAKLRNYHLSHCADSRCYTSQIKSKVTLFFRISEIYSILFTYTAISKNYSSLLADAYCHLFVKLRNAIVESCAAYRTTYGTLGIDMLGNVEIAICATHIDCGVILAMRSTSATVYCIIKSHSGYSF